MVFSNVPGPAESVSFAGEAMVGMQVVIWEFAVCYVISSTTYLTIRSWQQHTQFLFNFLVILYI